MYTVLTYSRNSGDFIYDLKELHKLGLKAIRLIYKGKTQSEFYLRIEEIQEQISHGNLDIDILIDLPGSKPIVGNVGSGLDVFAGEQYRLVNQNSDSTFSNIPTSGFLNHESFRILAVDDIISIADDELNLLIRNVCNDFIVCEALNSFRLTSNRSISVKNKPFSFQANSEKDIQFVQNLKLTRPNLRLLVSFAKKAEDITKLKSLQPSIDVIPKIETIIDDAELLRIMSCCETIMLGRGDLSISSLPHEIFIFQKR